MMSPGQRRTALSGHARRWGYTVELSIETRQVGAVDVQAHPAQPMAVNVVDPRHDRQWEELTKSTTGSLFTSPAWIRAVSDTYQFEPRASVATADGRPVAGLAYTEVRDLRGIRLSSLPFSDRADPVLRNPTSWDDIAADLVRSEHPYTLRCLEGTAPVGDGRFRVEHRAAWHATAVTGSPGSLFEGLHPSARRNVRVAERHGLEISASNELRAVRAFHALHVDLRKRKYRLLAPSVEFFERIWHEFHPDDGIVTMLALVDGQPVAGAVFLVWQDVLYYKFGASLASHLSVRPNDALFWAGIRYANSRGLSYVDWGLSELDQPGLVAYKRKWASTESRIVTLRTGSAPPGGGGELNALLSGLTRVLTRDDVSDAAAAEAGALLYRYFC